MLAANAALTSALLAAIATGAVARAPDGVARRLGLVAGRLSAARAAWLMLGMLGLSQSLECTITAFGVERGPVLDGLTAATQQAGALELGMLGLGVALAPALAEEIFARGWIQRGLEARVGPLPSIAASALLFGALHGHPVHSAAATVLGLWLGWIVHVDGGLRVAIAAHALNNATAIASAALLTNAPPAGSEAAGLSFGPSCTGVLAAGSFAALLGACILERRAVRVGRRERDGIRPPPSAAPQA